ncbi:hypothetical protein HMPREF9080_01452 [Cardiobacterium valvarum F0432]|uniref:Uncharacterized protein n=1 Tax=Cardiobacterium valvarum F0432 TaxID=797473 RepID=G9ZFA6_9GAMM|nr:hypothetical protein HMPREF9080_01452 [Cardiobacterium valvarum F0432]
MVGCWVVGVRVIVRKFAGRFGKRAGRLFGGMNAGFIKRDCRALF